MPELSDPVEALYREVVLEHYRHPRHRTPLESPDAEATVVNPVCGDQVLVQVAMGEERVQQICARARGCSIAVAAASVMTELVMGRDREEIAHLAEGARAVVSGAPLAPDLDDRLRAFARVAELPSRQRCALLAWEALDEALAAVAVQ